MSAKYANLLNDETFKVVICARGNEGLVAGMLNILLPEKKIKQLKFLDREQHGLAISDKNVTFDLYCTEENGEEFIVEMQGARQAHFADRMICYSTFPIRMQLERKLRDREEALKRGETPPAMNYRLLPIYVVSLLNFRLEHESDGALEEPDGLVSRYEIRNRRNGEQMTGALNFVFLELGRLKAGGNEPGKCRTAVERLAWSLKYMHVSDGRPETFEDDVLKQLYDSSEFANLSVEQQLEYEEKMFNWLDVNGIKEYAREEGLAEGRAEGRAEGASARTEEIARNLKADGLSPELVSRYTGLTPEQVQAL